MDCNRPETTLFMLMSIDGKMRLNKIEPLKNSFLLLEYEILNKHA
jgi:hypothetical protein